uniref:LisH domain-containing protein n=1 Tax=Rhabditophanes sp. KR3021 TaxID=114890 RepID=A0AC35U119_9BILA
MFILGTRSKNYSSIDIFKKLAEDSLMGSDSYLYRIFEKYFIEQKDEDALKQVLEVAQLNGVENMIQKQVKSDQVMANKSLIDQSIGDFSNTLPYPAALEETSGGVNMSTINISMALPLAVTPARKEIQFEESHIGTTEEESTFEDSTLKLTSTQRNESNRETTTVKEAASRQSINQTPDRGVVSFANEIDHQTPGRSFALGGYEIDTCQTPGRANADNGGISMIEHAEITELVDLGNNTTIFNNTEQSFCVAKQPIVLSETLDTVCEQSESLANEFSYNSSLSKSPTAVQYPDKLPRLSIVSSTPCRFGHTIPFEDCSFINNMSAIEEVIGFENMSLGIEDPSNAHQDSDGLFNDSNEEDTRFVVNNSNVPKNVRFTNEEFFNSISSIDRTDDDFDLFAAVDNGDTDTVVAENRRKSIAFEAIKKMMPIEEDDE